MTASSFQPVRRPEARDAWALRKGDLPAVRYRAREPLLEGLEENAVYRSMVFQAHRGSAWSRLHPVWRGLLIALLVMVGSVFSSVLLVVLVLVIFARVRRGRHAAEYFQMSEELMDELIDIPLPIRDWTVAVWGLGTTPMGRSAGRIAALMYLGFWAAVSAVALFAIGQDVVPWLSFSGGLSGFILGFIPFLVVREPHEFLPGSLSRLRQCRKMLEQKRNPYLRILQAIAVAIGVTCVLVFAVWMIGMALFVVLEIPGVEAALTSLFATLASIARARLGPVLFLVAGAVLGGCVAGLRRRRLRRSRDRRLGRMDDEMKTILRLLRMMKRPGEPQDADRRPQFYHRVPVLPKDRIETAVARSSPKSKTMSAEEIV